MENKARYTIVGIFFIFFSISMVAFILWLARYDIKEDNTKEYRIYSKSSISGLNENSIVEYKGLNIGLVKKIQIDPKNLEQIEIILKINKPNIIRENSFAIVQSQGVTGNKIIEINGGTNNSKILVSKNKSYSIIPLKKSFLDKLSSNADDISNKINTILYKFDKVLNKKNLNNIDNILSNVDKSSQNFNKMIKSSLVPTLNKIKILTNNINLVVKNNVPTTIENINTMTKNINTLSINIQNIVNTDIKNLISEFNQTAKSSKNIDLIIDELQKTLKKINGTIEDFDKNAGDILFKTRSEKYGPGEKQ